MRSARAVIWIVVAASALTACGKDIGDACIIDSDCDPNGGRTCDTSMTQGYCTILGCDYDTCPSEAVCIRFFSGGFDNRKCDRTDASQGQDQCDLDELCGLAGECVSRSSEARYCMKTCANDSDCRDGYECRGYDQPQLDGECPNGNCLAVIHGGEPVLAPGVIIDDSAPKFCAPAP